MSIQRLENAQIPMPVLARLDKTAFPYRLCLQELARLMCALKLTKALSVLNVLQTTGKTILCKRQDSS